MRHDIRHMVRHSVHHLVPRPILSSTLALLLAHAMPAHASFHLMEINKVLPSYNGDATIQAVELRMLAAGQILVGGTSIRTYDASGSPVATLGTFPGSVPNSGTDRKILCATAGFAAEFGITPDLVITPGIPLGTGQVSFETLACLVNAVAYGGVTTPVNGTTSAPEIPTGLAHVLRRTVNNTVTPSCPLAEDSAAKLGVVSASSAAPVAFSNNAGTTVNVFSSLTSADGPAPTTTWRVYPNPFGDALRIETPGSGPVAIYDVRGALVRRILGGNEAAGPRQVAWDGRNARGERVPAGIYFVRYGRGADRITARVAVLR